MTEIGGYFELELNDNGSIHHDDLLALNSGRNALEYIIIQRQYSKIYIPYYTCDVILQPLKRQNICFEFYFLNKDFYPKDIVVGENEVLLYVNYYGIMNNQVKNLAESFENLIVDNSQAFYETPLPNVDTFYSPRKFFGLPDGGFVSCPSFRDLNLERDVSIERMSHLLTRIEFGAEKGYKQFKTNDKKLDNIPLRKMSKLTEKLMRNIPFNQIKEKRIENFKYTHSKLRHINELTQIIDKNVYEAPMVYPFLRKGNKKLREKLIRHKVFVATYWPNVKKWLQKKDSLEFYLQDNLIALPIDQRYNNNDMERIISLIL